jgi:hypothetical protein
MPEDSRTAELELVIKGDPDIATTALQSSDVTMTMPKPTRFIAEAGAIIGVAAGLVKLVNALIDLAERLRKEPQAPNVTARNVAGEQLLLNSADNEAIKSFVHASAD